jgi:hypothetical protein
VLALLAAHHIFHISGIKVRVYGLEKYISAALLLGIETELARIRYIGLLVNITTRIMLLISLIITY